MKKPFPKPPLELPEEMRFPSASAGKLPQYCLKQPLVPDRRSHDNRNEVRS